MMDWDRINKELSKKLDPANVRPPSKFGPKGNYIEGWFAISEANRIFGFDGWSYTVLDCKCVSERPRKIGKDQKEGFGVSYVATVRVIVDSKTRDDVGAGHGYDLDCGNAHESAVKEAVTDALKRALRTFGNPFGLALYDKSRENVGVDRSDETERHRASLSGAETMDDLVKAWGAVPKDLQQELAGAKDERKAELNKKDAA